MDVDQVFVDRLKGFENGVDISHHMNESKCLGVAKRLVLASRAVFFFERQRQSPTNILLNLH